MKTKELQNIDNALKAFYNKYNGNVIINVSVFAFDDNDDVVDDHLWLCGDKDTLLLNNECMVDEIKNFYKDDLAVSE